jgi:dCMP deaminase
MTRPSADAYFMRIAHEAAARSTCNRARVGAVLVFDGHIVSTGYNGSIGGLEHCDDIGHLLVENHCIRTVHAEANAIAQAAKLGHATRGSVCYVTHFPCLHCVKALLSAGIAEVVYDIDYRMDAYAVMFLNKKGITYRKSSPRND